MTVLPNRSREVVSAIALLVALVIALGVPGGYALIRGFDEVAMLSLRARLNAARLGKYIYANERVWRYQAARLTPLIEETDTHAHPMHQRLIDERGVVILEEGVAVPNPAFHVRMPIVVGDRTIATLEATVSQRPLMAETAIVGLVAGLLGFGAWIAVRLLPLRALDRAVRELVEQTTRVQTATHESDLLRERERAAAEANSAKSGFLAMMSHEIRTPMNAVLGLAGTLLDNPLPSSQRRVVEAIRDSGDSLLRILNDILDFSKLDARKMVLEDVPFSPCALVNGVASILGTRAAAKGLRIVADCDPALPDGLLGDSGRIRQVLINLMSNAVKFTSVGQVTIAARCLSRHDTSAEVEWAVSDTGIGIAPDRIGSLFNEFMQADNSISRRFGGTGLGLAISKRLINQMGGTIGVESVPGEGTTFRARLILPITERPVDEVRGSGSGIATFEAMLKTLGRTPRVLFAEDNPTNQFVARELLKGLDLQVDMVGDGLEAVDATSRFTYDVICMDMQMPEMDGLAATRLIRSRGGRLATVPIIALTANAFPEDVRACLEAGMNQFVAKPVSREVLLTALRLALQGGAAPDAIAAMPSEPAAPSNLRAALATPSNPDATPLPPATEAQSGFDPEALDGLRKALGPDSIAEMIVLFDKDTRARLRLVEAGGLDAKTLVREVHSLKGSASTVGATALAALASALERRLKAGEAMTDTDLSALSYAFDNYMAAMNRMFACKEPAL